MGRNAVATEKQASVQTTYQNQHRQRPQSKTTTLQNYSSSVQPPKSQEGAPQDKAPCS